MRTMTTNEVTSIVSLINKVKELNPAHNLSIGALKKLCTQANKWYNLVLSDAIVHQSNLIDPLETACDIIDELIEEYDHNAYNKRVENLWSNGEYDAQPDSIRRSK
tara:strand:- start:117 stop:434 length:318 start_codon:yes stop_codon:yes gene_type:complete